MKIFYTDQAIESLNEVLNFLSLQISNDKVLQIRDSLIAKIEVLAINPHIGQREKYLHHLGNSHRRIIEGHYKIIYRVENDMVYIVDIFDTRQDPEKMKG